MEKWVLEKWLSTDKKALVLMYLKRSKIGPRLLLRSTHTRFTLVAK